MKTTLKRIYRGRYEGNYKDYSFEVYNDQYYRNNYWCYMLYKNGELIDRHNGCKTKTEITILLLDYILFLTNKENEKNQLQIC